MRTRIEPIDRDIAVMLADIKGPAQSAALASFAREKIEEAKAQNAGVLGRPPKYEVYVDGSKGGRIEAVKPDGRIVAEFELLEPVLTFIAEALDQAAPVKTGRYQRSRRLFVDGAEVALSEKIPATVSEIIFAPLVDYAARIERGWSKTAPDGVYQVVAVMAQRRFGNIAKISFTYRALVGGSDRQPAIVVKVK